MRFMIIVKGTPAEENGPPPSSELIAEMGKFNAELIEAGVLLAGEGLQPSKFGAKVSFGKDKQEVVDGPFTEAKELVGGFWILSVKDLAEAVAWARRIPFTEGEVEVRRVSEVTDFVEDDISREALQTEAALRASGRF
ncbi:YciI family protein [Devosia sp.]|jgi:hypothetical protein|uniref:YciI family protein n=1 Tax=Devosia sp. TaxID=1871048 RepID=UPI0037BFCB2E